MLKILKRHFITGLLILIPLILTLFLFFEALSQIDALIPYRILGIPPIPGLGIIMVVLIILITGMIARNYFGRKIIALGDNLFAKIPIISRIYSAIKQIIQTFVAENSELFQKVVLIEYPRKGIYSIGFFTQNTRGIVQDAIAEDVVSIFLPTTPNPTSGILLFVPKRQVVQLDMSIEDAMKLIISGGAVVPNANPQFNKILPIEQSQK